MRVGEREVIHTATLILPTKEDAWVDFMLGSWHVRVNVAFRNDPSEPGKPISPAGIELESKDDHAKLTLTNWANPLGTATKQPVEFATTSDGAKVYLMIWHTSTGGEVERLDLQFLLEPKK